MKPVPFFWDRTGDERNRKSPLYARHPTHSRSRRFLTVSRFGIIIILALCLTASGASAAVYASLGDTISLSGIAYSTTVYLFVTGPNLPAEGVALNDISSGGSFTRVPVDADNRWSYNWDTHRIPLDAGTYSVWVVDAPVGRTGLADHDYSRISVSLSRPSISVSLGEVGSGDTTVVPGTLEITSIPENSSVVIGGQYRGATPLVVPVPAPATYTVTVSHFGYYPVTRQVTVGAGATTFINATLAPSPGAIRVETDPAGASIRVDGGVAANSPLTLENITAGNHTVTAELLGYTTAESTVTVAGNQTTNISLTLQHEVPIPTQAGNSVITGIGILAAGIAAFAACRHRNN